MSFHSPSPDGSQPAAKRQRSVNETVDVLSNLKAQLLEGEQAKAELAELKVAAAGTAGAARQPAESAAAPGARHFGSHGSGSLSSSRSSVAAAGKPPSAPAAAGSSSAAASPSRSAGVRFRAHREVALVTELPGERAGKRKAAAAMWSARPAALRQRAAAANPAASASLSGWCRPYSSRCKPIRLPKEM